MGSFGIGARKTCRNVESCARAGDVAGLGEKGPSGRMKTGIAFQRAGKWLQAGERLCRAYRCFPLFG